MNKKKSASQKEKLSSKKIKNKKIDMDSLHFIPNNILTRLFKELTKYINGYQQYLNYIYWNYIMHLIVYL